MGELELTQETRETITTNFAEAALVLQNSSNVYSRKVDYLHKYAFSLQEELTKKKTTRKTGMDQQVEDFLNFDPHMNFLPLDDVLPIDSIKINRHRDLPTTTTPRSNTNSQRLSLSQRLSTSKRHSSSNTTGSHLDKTDTAVSLRTLNSMSSLRLTNGSCDMNEEGVLWMPGSQSSKSPAVSSLSLDGVGGDTTTHAHHDSFDHTGADATFDDDNDGGGFAMNDDDVPMEDDNTGQEANNLETVAAQKKRVTFAVGDIAADNDEPPPDPWEMLDRDVPDTVKPRSLRIGQTIVLPPNIFDVPSNGVTGSRTRRKVTNRPPPPRPGFMSVIPLQGLAYGTEFEYIQREFLKRQQQERRRLQKQQREATAQNSASGSSESNTTDAPIGTNEYDFGGEDDYGEDDDNGNFDFDTDEGLLGSNTETLDQVLARNHEEDEAEESQTFQELCRAHLQRFAQGAKKYAAETDLTQRVSQWQEKLVPILQAEDERAEFNIYEYGQAVLSDMEEQIRRQSIDDDDKQSSPVVPFHVVTKGRERYEVCRIFLAALTLNNSGNVQFQSNLDLELLECSVERPMETYVAPSLLNN